MPDRAMKMAGFFFVAHAMPAGADQGLSR